MQMPWEVLCRVAARYVPGARVRKKGAHQDICGGMYLCRKLPGLIMTEVVPHRWQIFNNLHNDMELSFSGPCGQFHSLGAFAALGELETGAGAPPLLL